MNDRPRWMQAIVVGGAANGMIVNQVLVDAERIELSRPDYIKPLAYSDQKEPEVERVRDTYQVCTLWLQGEQPDPVPFGLIIEDGKTVRWAVSELCKGFAQNVINELSAEKLSQ